MELEQHFCQIKFVSVDLCPGNFCQVLKVTQTFEPCCLLPMCGFHTFVFYKYALHCIILFTA